MDIEIDVVDGAEGVSLYIDGTRVSGLKPWGGGNTLHSFKVSVEDVKKILKGKSDDRA